MKRKLSSHINHDDFPASKVFLFTRAIEDENENDYTIRSCIPVASTWVKYTVERDERIIHARTIIRGSVYDSTDGYINGIIAEHVLEMDVILNE